MGIVELLSGLFSGLRKPIPHPTLQLAINSSAIQPSVPTQVALDLMKIDYKESPNKSERKDTVRGIVLHHTGPGSFDGIVNWLTNPVAKVSAHYVIGQKGEIKQLVNTRKAAWHAGPSKAFLDGQIRYNLNNCTIGIEICNVGVLQKHDDGKFYYEIGETIKEWRGAEPAENSITYPSGKILVGYSAPYTQIQKDKIVELCKALVDKYPQIEREDILTHYEISQPEGRKNDPFGLDIEEIKNKIFGV